MLPTFGFYIKLYISNCVLLIYDNLYYIQCNNSLKLNIVSLVWTLNMYSFSCTVFIVCLGVRKYNTIMIKHVIYLIWTVKHLACHEMQLNAKEYYFVNIATLTICTAKYSFMCLSLEHIIIHLVDITHYVNKMNIGIT